MVRKPISILAALAVSALGACVSAPEINRATYAMDAEWQIELERLREQDGSRTYGVGRDEAFTAMLRGVQSLGLTVLRKDKTSGTVKAVGIGPKPLTEEEWAQAEAVDSPAMRRIVQREIGPLSSALFYLKADAYQMNFTVVVSGDSRQSTISLDADMERIAPGISGVRWPKAPPPEAAKIGLAKIWRHMERELAAHPVNAGRPAAPSVVPVAAAMSGPTLSIASEIETKDTVAVISGFARNATEISVDGEIVPVQPSGAFSKRLYVPVGGSDVRIAAVGRSGAVETRQVSVVRRIEKAEASYAKLDPSKVSAKPRPNAIALIIGIDKYENAPPAEFAEKDARLFYDYAVNSLGVPRDRIRLLTGSEARKLDVEKALLNWMRPLIARGQTDVFIFFSGHGLASDDGKDLYLVPHDGDPSLLARSALRRKEIIDIVAEAGASSTTMFLDACYSGGTRGKDTLVVAARPVLLAAKDQGVPANVTIISAAANDQLSSALIPAGHGLFSYWLMKGLEGDAAGGGRTITAAKLKAYLVDKVPPEAAKLGRVQTPQLIGDGDRVVVSW
jgi:hypothetical protein